MLFLHPVGRGYLCSIPECNGKNGLNAVCLIAEVSVFFLNIFCVVIGIGTYIWFSWLQRRDQLKGSVKAVCATLVEIANFSLLLQK